MFFVINFLTLITNELSVPTAFVVAAVIIVGSTPPTAAMKDHCCSNSGPPRRALDARKCERTPDESDAEAYDSGSSGGGYDGIWTVVSSISLPSPPPATSSAAARFIILLA